MRVEIDQNSGFCFGVVYAIEMAEDHLRDHGQLYCLGDIVHNNMEVERLEAMGLEIIDHERLGELKDSQLTAVPIGKLKVVFCASPDYIKTHKNTSLNY